MPRIYVEEELKTGALHELPWQGAQLNMFIQMMYHKDKWHSGAIVALMNIVREYSSEQKYPYDE